MVVVAAVPMVLVVVATSGCGGSDNGIGCSGDGDNGGGVARFYHALTEKKKS